LGQSDSQVHLEHSDHSSFSFGDKGGVYKFWGNVHFVRGKSDLYADSAARYEQPDRVELYGHVRIIEPDRTVRADTLFYDATAAIADAWGGVTMTHGADSLAADSVSWFEGDNRFRLFSQASVADSTRSLQGDTIYYNDQSREAEAWGNVTVKDFSRHVRVDGGHAWLQQADQTMTMTRDSRLILDFDRPTTPTVVLADTITFNGNDNTVTAVDSVRITQGSLRATSQHAVFYTDKEEFCLTGSVHAWQHNSYLSGDEMNVFSKDKILQRIDVSGSGETIYKQEAQADSLVYNESRLTADNIDFFFADDRLSTIHAKGNSYTYYTPAPQDTVTKGSNVASGDSTILEFASTGLKRGWVITSAEGIYTSPLSYDSLGNIATLDSVRYQASRIRFEFDSSVIYLKTSAQVKEGTVTLDADHIRYNVNTQILNAGGIYDSTDAKYEPIVLRDGTEEIRGEELAYDLRDKRGKIKKSRTEMEQAYYAGNVLRKEEEDVLLVQSGKYTTCDLEQPHYHFEFPDMKMKSGDKVWARPVILYIETLPVLALPYFVFSVEKGRHSGFLPFKLGNFSRGQRFVNNIGYYWAASEYWDMSAALDISEGSGLSGSSVRLNLGFRYALRYKLSGSISGTYGRDTQFDPVTYKRLHPKRWDLQFSHNQTIDPSLTIRGSGNFVSDSRYYTDFSTNLEERLNRQLHSQFNINKRWESASLTAAVDQTKYLDLNSHSEKLPTVSFSLNSRTIFRPPEDAADRRWYHDLRYRYGANFNNSSSKSEVSGVPTRNKKAVLNQSVSLSATPKFFNAISLQPSVTVNDYWYYLPYSDQAEADSLETNAVKNRQTWSSSMRLSTNLYGTVTPNMLGIVGFRHIMTPGATFSYTPKFTRNAEYAAFTGSGVASSIAKQVSFSVQNQFQMKYLKDGEERKVTLLNVGISASHNFVKEERRWSSISTSIRAPSIRSLTLEVSMSHTPYSPSTGALRWWSPYLESITVKSGFSGAINIPGEPAATVSPLEEPVSRSNQLRFQISEYYSESGRLTNTYISHWVNISFSFNITKNWHIEYQQRYDLRLKESADKVVSLHRDLHCWEGSFSWIPTGSRQGYYFKLNAKLLPELKFEKSESGIRDALF
jgi:lipopolysaccharide assembly outer membrane protein LptD (OstA)